MTNQFTTPEFADVLKQHGIEIDTIFVHYDNRVWASHLNNYDVYTLIDTDTGSMVISSNIEVKPCYLLSQVLGWLPFSVVINELDCEVEVWLYGKRVSYDYKNQYGTFATGNPEKLITQGLTEGWLNKEIIEQQIKQNQ